MVPAGRPQADGARLRFAGFASLLALVVAYAIQVATPLRLNGDSVIYLSMARSISTGHGIPRNAAFPPGLPGLYALLDLVGAGRSWAIVTLNLAFAVVAVSSTIFLYRRALGISPQASLLLGCAALLSYVLVKHAALAVSDVPFLGLASTALALLTVAAHGSTGRRWWALAFGMALVACAITVRAAGVALLPATLIAAADAARAGQPLGRWLRKPRTVGGIVGCAAAGAGLAVALSLSGYLGKVSTSYGTGRSGQYGSAIGAHLRNWGEIALNVPETRLPGALLPLLQAAGVLIVVILVAGLWRLRRRLEPVHAFASSYLVVTFVWPYGDARFWLPLVPLALGYAFVALQPLLRFRAATLALAAYAAAFTALGIAGLAYDTRLSYSGARFPDRYGTDVAGQTLQPTYRVAFGEARPGDAALVNEQALAVLRHWEARARP